MSIGAILIQVFVFCHKIQKTDRPEVCTRAYAWCIDHGDTFEKCKEAYGGKNEVLIR